MTKKRKRPAKRSRSSFSRGFKSSISTFFVILGMGTAFFWGYSFFNSQKNSPIHIAHPIVNREAGVQKIKAQKTYVVYENMKNRSEKRTVEKLLLPAENADLSAWMVEESEREKTETQGLKPEKGSLPVENKPNSLSVPEKKVLDHDLSPTHSSKPMVSRTVVSHKNENDSQKKTEKSVELLETTETSRLAEPTKLEKFPGGLPNGAKKSREDNKMESSTSSRMSASSAVTHPSKPTIQAAVGQEHQNPRPSNQESPKGIVLQVGEITTSLPDVRQRRNNIQKILSSETLEIQQKKIQGRFFYRLVIHCGKNIEKSSQLKKMLKKRGILVQKSGGG